MRLGRLTASTALALALLAAPLAAEAQQAGKVYRIGVPRVIAAHRAVFRWEAFLNELRERGYVEGQNLVIEPRYSEGKEQSGSLSSRPNWFG